MIEKYKSLNYQMTKNNHKSTQYNLWKYFYKTFKKMFKVAALKQPQNVSCSCQPTHIDFYSV